MKWKQISISIPEEALPYIKQVAKEQNRTVASLGGWALLQLTGWYDRHPLNMSEFIENERIERTNRR